MDLAERISTLRRANGLSARQLAALVDVAPTTVTRIEAGSVSPSFDLAQEIMRVLGEPIGFTGGADPDAIAAGRLSLDPTLQLEATEGVRAWWERWARIRLVGDDGTVAPGQRENLLFRAATAARLSRRAGSVDFLPTSSARDLANALDRAGLEYALTGDTAANLYSPGAGEVWPVLYVADIASAIQAAHLERRDPLRFGARVTLIPFDGVCELRRERIDGAMVAALDQVILDCFGGTGRMAEQADLLLGRAG
ncbi:transcriptional regulator, XRE family [Xylanimonas cellulosilytica DSM 15894]|uniref:Transcriptional regulator, XRE family n=1 Tax=Xylanimonas cellulosilytica (strain DSM 15894 / JCM 12276 / CECT 5975 / KCTC 9989 / LMG 20990 / NBRC 107835 / XIL07) TaxID=446471 RepID=D1BUB4_XYLCX|nr:helix-turn-helix transcriptional regulator [Xylanimonas cellulosilytica]ACZ31127.1 transcriptional regulator, XRE family [Xylanimonas cellulosilytica DSM 15894]